MHPSTSETAIMILFSQGLQSYLPLGSNERLANQNLGVPVSYVFGDADWMRHCEEDFAKEVVMMTQPTQPDNHFYVCSRSGHNLHIDNPIGLTSLMKAYFLGLGSCDKSE